MAQMIPLNKFSRNMQHFVRCMTDCDNIGCCHFLPSPACNPMCLSLLEGMLNCWVVQGGEWFSGYWHHLQVAISWFFFSQNNSFSVFCASSHHHTFRGWFWFVSSCSEKQAGEASEYFKSLQAGVVHGSVFVFRRCDFTTITAEREREASSSHYCIIIATHCVRILQLLRSKSTPTVHHFLISSSSSSVLPFIERDIANRNRISVSMF